jgi:crotonobetainyl-CoA:carnitine CoA-transferase CaiB-like acyl-CoA transferase
MGPLKGVRVIELAGLAPGPFGCMMLADLGADVVLVDRPDPVPPALLRRGRRVVTLDLKTPSGLAGLLDLVEQADVLVEGFRPGVAERLGFGPAECLRHNPRLVYARLTGWGQSGPLADRAGHDIDYLALAGALSPLGRPGERPHAPLNLLADFAGGGLLLAVGVLAALLERARSGAGQVIDAAMVDGSALLTTFLHGLIAAGQWPGERGTNLLDGGAPFYDTYATADGAFMAVGAIEPPFYAELLAGLDLSAEPLPAQYDQAGWPILRRRFTERFAQRTREDWTLIFTSRDACVTPVLSPTEAPAHPHNRERETFTQVGADLQPSPAPRFSRTPPAPPQPAAPADLALIIDEWRTARDYH